MTDQNSKPWQFKQGQSGNPNGRPKGITDKRVILRETFESEGKEVALKVIEAALNGDMQAAKIVLDRLAPAIKPRAELVKFDLDITATITEQAKATLSAIADGVIDPYTGQSIINAISGIGKLIELDEMTRRIEVLEERQNEK